MKKTIRFFSQTTLLIACLLLVNACSRNPVTGKKQVSFMSEEKEKALGLQSDPSIVAQYGMYQDDRMQKFIEEKGQQMAKISHRPNLPFKFRILDSPVVNAFAVPGGYVYFTRGIMAHFNNEAEFAGVLGHEIGHVTARHAAEQYTKQIGVQAGLMAAMIFSKDARQYGQELGQAAGLLNLKFGRDDESQSDKLGVEYSTKVGYDAHEMANFFSTINRLQKKAGAEVPDFLSTHPNPVDRYNKVHGMANDWQKDLGTSNLKVNRESYLRMIDGLTYGEDPRQGFVENSNFYHPDLKFQFPIPSGWKHQNSPAQFAMVSPDQKAIMALKVAQEKDLSQAAQAFITNNKLQQKENRRVNVNGLPAIAVVADAVPEQQQGQQQQGGQQAQPLRLMSYFIEYNGLIYQLFGYAQLNDFDRYARDFSTSMQGFKVLRDPSKLNAQPEKIRIKTAYRSANLQETFRALNVPQDRMEELAILNGMQLSDMVKSGSLIKVIGK